jgi:anaerobic selenocysteine-containing dehydrogenase
LIHIKDGRLEKVEAAQSHPVSALFTRVVTACPRARGAAEWFHHPDRLKHPLKRVGERGGDKWQEISWEQALDEIAAKLKEIRDGYGAEAVTTSVGTYRTHDEYRGRFFNLFGSPNSIGQGIICYGPSNTLSAAMIGWPTNFTRIYSETRCVMLCGTNPVPSSRIVWFQVLDAQRQGAKLIVVDPRRTETAEHADIWLQLRPGTDTALYMGMINIIINEGLYDEDFVSRWCHGFDELAQRAQEYPVGKVAEITWVPADRIREAARVFATSKPAAIFNMMGLEHIANSIEALQARFILPAITGNIDVRGGTVIRPPHPTFISDYETEFDGALPSSQKEKAIGATQFKLQSLIGFDLVQENLLRVWGRGFSKYHTAYAHAPSVYRAMVTGKPYPIRAMITLSSNPIVTQANSKLVYKALMSLDLHVVMDFWMTPSAQLADYILPAASWLERPTINTLSGIGSYVDAGEAAFPAVVEGEYDRRRDYDLWRGLGIRLGQEDHWPWETLEEAYDYRLTPLGYTLNEFVTKKGGYDSARAGYQKYEKMGFATPTGKVELYSTILERLGYDALPKYEEPPESPVSTPELSKEYPLVLITGGRFQPMYHSEHRQIESWRKQHPDPIVQINPKTATELGIGNGDWVWIESPRGRVRQKCQYFEGIDPRVIHTEHGWWFPELPGEEPWLHGAWESNINVLTDDEPEHCNKINGGWPLRAGLCKVYKVKQY